MILQSSISSLAWIGCVAACLACGAAQTPAPVAAPAAAPASPEASPSPAVEVPVEQAPEPVQQAPQGASIQQTIELVAKRNFWPLAPDKAESLLASLGPVQRQQSAEHALSLKGGPSGALARYDVSYSSDEKGAWAFSVANFAFADADLRALYATVSGRLTERLGKAEWAQQGEEIPSTEWGLGNSMKLLLARSPSAGENALVISIAEPEGEGEEE